jgi:hypothetical protein
LPLSVHGRAQPPGADGGAEAGLEEKDYAALERREGFGFEVSFAYLTASGWDLIDGLVRERGVDGEI